MTPPEDSTNEKDETDLEDDDTDLEVETEDEGYQTGIKYKINLLFLLKYSQPFYFIFVLFMSVLFKGSSWSCSYSSWIYNYLCNQCISSVKL